jgi:xylulokinase
MGKEGYPCVPYAIPGLYCTYILNFSCGSTIDWIRKRIMHGYAGEEGNFFAYIEKDLPGDPTGLLVLPYFGGASTPHQNIHAKGVILGVDIDTGDTELFQGIMEGLCMEMRYNFDVVTKYGIKVDNLVATGGGAKSRAWLTIKSNVQNLPVKRLRSSEGGLCGCAVLSAVAVGGLNFEGARERFVRYADVFTPDAERHAAYEPTYEKYKRLYASVKELF